jgi:exosortase C (VPDSG-CTERM-specific)
MNKSKEALAEAWSARKVPSPVVIPRRSPWFPVAITALVLAFSRPLYQLSRFALDSELYSYILLVPIISLYLWWTQRKSLPAHSTPHRTMGVVLLVAGILLLAGYWTIKLSGTELVMEDSLAMTMLAFVLLFWGIAGWFLGPPTMRALAFPLVFLLFMVPFPIFLQSELETLLQAGSAVAAYAFFKTAGTPVFNEGLVFQLPGISLQIAPECSGIHSTLALFITSLVAGQMLLRSPWKRALLALAVVPIALLRNGFRVFVIGELCVHVSPDMIDSYIHHHGGPIFFALSLIPFFLLLRLLYKSDQLTKPSPS